jgi:hypothetical protein
MPSEFLSAYPALAVGAQALTASKEQRLVFIESEHRTDLYRLNYQLSGQKLPNNATNVTLIINDRGWALE